MQKPKIVIAAGGLGLLIAAVTFGVVAVGADSNGATTATNFQDRLTVLRNAQTASADAAVVACMTKSGFKYITPPEVVNPRNALTPRQDLLRYGYGVNTAPVLNPAADPNTSYLAALPAYRRDAYRRALKGAARPRSVVKPSAGTPSPSAGPTAATGCRAVSYEHYMGPLAPIIERAISAREHMYEGLAADPRMVKVYGQWSTCMAQSGYHYARLQTILDDLARDSKTPGRKNSPKARAHELAIAKVDSDCRDRYVESTYQAVLTGYLTSEAPGNEKLLAEADRAVAQTR